MLDRFVVLYPLMDARTKTLVLMRFLLLSTILCTTIVSYSRYPPAISIGVPGKSAVSLIR